MKFIVSDIREILNFRYKKSFKSWKEFNNLDINKFDEPPEVFKYFEYCITEDGFIFYNKNGMGVLCNPKKLDLLDSKITSDFLLIAGADTNLSDNLDVLASIKNNFDKIYYEAKDIECDWVKSYPCGINYAYLFRCGENNVLNVINSKINKEKNICASFGSKWPDLNKIIKDRIDLVDFCSKNHELIDYFVCDPKYYYKKISEYKFMACPNGAGIQCPKLWECLLVETIPIVKNHIIYRDFEKYNFPFIFIDDWEELKDFDFEYIYDNLKIDWTSVKNKLLVKNFNIK